MNRRKIWFFSSLIVTLSTIIFLVMGSSLLMIALDDANSVPLGTFITWAGIISLPLSIYWGVKELRKPTTKVTRIIAMLLKTILILAILWVPISYILAGNLSFSFSEKEIFQGGQIAMKWFWRLSYGIGFGSIFSLIMYWISLILKKRYNYMPYYNNNIIVRYNIVPIFRREYKSSKYYCLSGR